MHACTNVGQATSGSSLVCSYSHAGDMHDGKYCKMYNVTLSLRLYSHAVHMLDRFIIFIWDFLSIVATALVR